MNRIFPGSTPESKRRVKSGYCGQCVGGSKGAAVATLPSYSLANADLARAWDAGGDGILGYRGDRLEEADTASSQASKSADQLCREADALVDTARQQLKSARASGGDKNGVKAAKAKLKEAKQVQNRAKRMATSAAFANPRNRGYQFH